MYRQCCLININPKYKGECPKRRAPFLFFMKEDAAAEADSLMLNAYVYQLVNQLRQNGRNRTAETYRCALNSLLRFLPVSDIELSRIDAPLMHDYERYLQNRGLQSNSSSLIRRLYIPKQLVLVGDLVTLAKETLPMTTNRHLSG